MKLLLFLSLALLSSVSSSVAGFKLPSNVYKYDQVEEAAKAAQENGKALMFILSNTGTT